MQAGASSGDAAMKEAIKEAMTEGFTVMGAQMAKAMKQGFKEGFKSLKGRKKRRKHKKRTSANNSGSEGSGSSGDGRTGWKKSTGAGASEEQSEEAKETRRKIQEAKERMESSEEDTRPQGTWFPGGARDNTKTRVVLKAAAATRKGHMEGEGSDKAPSRESEEEGKRALQEGEGSVRSEEDGESEAGVGLFDFRGLQKLEKKEKAGKASSSGTLVAVAKNPPAKGPSWKTRLEAQGQEQDDGMIEELKARIDRVLGDKAEAFAAR